MFSVQFTRTLSPLNKTNEVEYGLNKALGIYIERA